MTALAQEHDLNLLPPADLVGEIERLKDELQNERDRNLRSIADFKNYRRRAESNGSKIAEEGKRTLILSLLDIIDDLEKAILWPGGVEKPLLQGVRIIHQKLITLLEAHKVFPFESVGMLFDHNLHDAVAMVEHSESEPGTVVGELRRGYFWNNELLRPAQVQVAE